MSKQAFFLMRLNDHIQYLKKIEATLEGKDKFYGNEHHKCKLGQWLYGEGNDEIAALEKDIQAKEIFDALFEPHEQFHTASHIAIEKKLAGDNKGAQEQVTNMYKLSRIITQKLLELDVLN